MGYFESLKQNYRNDYLTESPRKREVLDNARKEGNVSILPNSNNRAVVIDAPETVYLQSYDTLILATDKASGDTIKLWDGYTATTMKHINEYLCGRGHRMMGKKDWTAINVGGTV